MKKSSNTSSTLSSSKKRKYSLLLDELYRSADPVCVQAANEIQIQYNTIRQNNRNYILLMNALAEIQYIAYARDKNQDISMEQLENRLQEIINIVDDIRNIVDKVTR